MEIKPIIKDGKVSAVVIFYNQEQFKKQVLKNINADELIIVENKGNQSYQRTLGLQQAKHEYVLFCDGDIVVDTEFIMQAQIILKNIPSVAIVGGLITTPMETPAQEMMAILRYRAFHKSHNIDGCYLVRRELFNFLKFDNPPHELKSFYEGIKKLGLRQEKIKYKLLHLGEPTTITELYQRQCKYGVAEKHNHLLTFLFNKPSLGRYIFGMYKDYIFQMCNEDGYKFNSSYKDLSYLFAGFMQIYFTTASVKQRLEK